MLRKTLRSRLARLVLVLLVMWQLRSLIRNAGTHAPSNETLLLADRNAAAAGHNGKRQQPLGKIDPQVSASAAGEAEAVDGAASEAAMAAGGFGDDHFVRLLVDSRTSPDGLSTRGWWTPHAPWEFANKSGAVFSLVGPLASSHRQQSAGLPDGGAVPPASSHTSLPQHECVPGAASATSCTLHLSTSCRAESLHAVYQMVYFNTSVAVDSLRFSFRLGDRAGTQSF